MRKWSKKAAAVLFMASMAVYPVRAFSAEPGTDTKSSDVKLLEEQGTQEAAPTTQPTESEGTSVDNSQVNVSDAGTVEIHVNEANLVEVLRMLSLQSQKNIIASKDVRGTVTANLYNVTIKEALDAILASNGFGYREKGNFIYVYTSKELADMEKAERQMVTEVIRLHYTNAMTASTMIKPALSADAVVSFSAPAEKGIGAAGTDAGGNSHATEDVMVVRDYPEYMEKVRKIVQEVDRRPQQVMVEATIMAARLNDSNALGVDFNFLGGIDFTEIIHTEGQLRQANLPTGADAFEVGDRLSSAGTGSNFTNPLKKGFKFGLVSQNVSVFVNALEEIADTSVLANPKVLTLNKQKGEVLVGREDGYLTTTFTDTTAIQTIEFLQTGTRLVFRPYIGNDGYIRMEVHPEDSDGKVVGGLPQKTTTEVTTNIMVKDGHTIVIGGLFRESTAVSRNQVPVLGNLPIVGALFRNQVDSTAREEIIILLTPHIIKDEVAMDRDALDMAKEFEKLRVGVRRGMMPWGRERMAESAYEAAVNEMKKSNPDRKRALWHLDVATNLNPKFIEAIRMRENLSGKELTTYDASIIRNYVRNLTLAERKPAVTELPAFNEADELAGEPEAMPVEGSENQTASTETESVEGEYPMGEEEIVADEEGWLSEEEMAGEEFSGEEVTEVPVEEIEPAEMPVEEPMTETPAFEEPAAEPAVEEPSAEEPSVEEPAAEPASEPQPE